jgi:glycosyltransferase involved in cell wall biosynthesis
LKNEGAKLARGEIVVFLDSDVIPDDGWLINLVDPLFENKDIKVLAGNTYLDYQSLKSKAFALAWFFNLRADENYIGIRNQGFQANNVAFRKDIITAYRFPAMPEGVTRKSCVMLAKQLEGEGIPIWTNTGAQVSHPVPNGFYHFFIRALAQGRDTLLYDHHNKFLMFLKDFYMTKIVSSCIKIIFNGKKVNLPYWQAPIAMGLMMTYYTVALTGAVITFTIPRYAKSSWRI